MQKSENYIFKVLGPNGEAIHGGGGWRFRMPDVTPEELRRFAAQAWISGTSFNETYHDTQKARALLRAAATEIELLTAEPDALAARVAELEAALRFYANPATWHEIREQDTPWDRAVIDASDEEAFPPDYESIGGKRARTVLGIVAIHRDWCADSGVSVCLTQQSCTHTCECCRVARATLRGEGGGDVDSGAPQA